MDQLKEACYSKNLASLIPLHPYKIVLRISLPARPVGVRGISRTPPTLLLHHSIYLPYFVSQLFEPQLFYGLYSCLSQDENLHGSSALASGDFSFNSINCEMDKRLVFLENSSTGSSRSLKTYPYNLFSGDTYT
jgi:hypothetical protein